MGEKYADLRAGLLGGSGVKRREVKIDGQTLFVRDPRIGEMGRWRIEAEQDDRRWLAIATLNMVEKSNGKEFSPFFQPADLDLILDASVESSLGKLVAEVDVRLADIYRRHLDAVKKTASSSPSPSQST